MADRPKSEQVDATIQAALDSLPKNDRAEVDEAARRLADSIRSRPGGKFFGITRGRELLFSIGAFLNSKDV